MTRSPIAFEVFTGKKDAQKHDDYFRIIAGNNEKIATPEASPTPSKAYTRAEGLWFAFAAAQKHPDAEPWPLDPFRKESRADTKRRFLRLHPLPITKASLPRKQRASTTA